MARLLQRSTPPPRRLARRVLDRAEAESVQRTAEFAAATRVAEVEGESADGVWMRWAT